MALEVAVICDYCGKPMDANEKRAEVQVAEYSEPHRDGYVIPAFRDLHFHWTCYEQELPKAITNSNG